MEQILFIVLSAIAILGALSVIFSKSPVYSILSLVVTFFAIAGHFVLLNAQFLAIVNIIVYAGAIMVLFLFVIMLLNLNKISENTKPFMVKLIGSVTAGLLLLTLIGALKATIVSTKAEALHASANLGTVKNLGIELFSNFLLPFEISSVLFLSAMIGAVMLGKKNLKDS